MRSITSSGIGSSPWYQGARLEITDAIATVFQICGTFSIVRSSISRAQRVDDRAEVVLVLDAAARAACSTRATASARRRAS